MKAIVNTEYGTPDVLLLKEVPKPTPKENELLIKIHATTVNRTDCGFRNPEYLFVRLVSGVLKPKNQVLGSEFSGTIETVGSKVTQFAPGNAVFGLKTYTFGTHAEYVCLPENGSVAHKPHNMSHQQAAAVCDGLMLAINYIGKMDFTKKPDFLVNGASGSIGSASVQLAKYYGANVTAVCNTKNLELLKSLGADEVIDYTTTDFTQHNKQYDYVLDAVGKSSFFKCKKMLKPKGIYYSSELGYMAQNIFLALITPLLGGKKTLFPIPTDSQKDILLFKKIIEEGMYMAVIDRTYRMEQIIEATKYVETGEKTGNVVIDLE